MAALVAVAEKAVAVGSALSQLLDPVADSFAEITALIAQCFSTSSSLRRLCNAITDHQYPDRHRRVSADVTTVRVSLEYTFEDAQRIFRNFRRDVPLHTAYRRVWTELEDYFWDESQNTLSRRLGYCQDLLDHLTDTLVEGYSTRFLIMAFSLTSK